MGKFFNKLPHILYIATAFLMLFSSLFLIFSTLIFFDIINFYWSYNNVEDTFKDRTPILLTIIISKVFIITTHIYLLHILSKIKLKQPFEKKIVKRFYVFCAMVFMMPFFENLSMIVAQFSGYFFSDLIIYNNIFDKFTSFLLFGLTMLTCICLMNKGYEISEEQKLTV